MNRVAARARHTFAIAADGRGRRSESHRVTWLVLCGHDDVVARWAHEQLRALNAETVELVTDVDLVGAGWDHRVGDDAVVTEIHLSDGRTLGSGGIRGTLNRLTHAPPALAGMLAPADREYGHTEFSALWLSWLAALDGPVLNPPTTRGFSGAWRSSVEWAVLAADASLECIPLTDDSGDAPGSAGHDAWEVWPPYAPVREDAIVVGESVFSARRLDRATRDACRRLSKLADTPILGLVFADTPIAGRPRLRGATPMPDLRAAGTPLVSALASALGGTHPARAAVRAADTATR